MPINKPNFTFVKSFAESGAKNIVPTSSFSPSTEAAASLTDGFPPITATPIEAGGYAPNVRDINGILNQISQHIVWANAGGRYQFDSVIAEAGGYPVGAVVYSDNFSASYRNIVQGNSGNFNTLPELIGASWIIESGGDALQNQTTAIASLSTSTSTALATSVSSVSSLSTSTSMAINAANSSVSSLSTAIYDSRFVGMIIASPTENPLPGTIKLNGACINVSVYSRLAAVIYCGDAKNETAVSCYKCTDVGGTIRSTTGIYLKLPEYRAEFMRFWDDGRGVDVGREINSYQLDAIQNITGFINGIQNSPSMTLGGAGGAFAQVDNLVNGNDNSGGAPVFNMTFDASRVVRTATETRSRNVAPLACIVY